MAMDGDGQDPPGGEGATVGQRRTTDEARRARLEVLGRRFQRYLTRVENVFAVAGVAGVVAMGVLIVASAGGRTLFNRPIELTPDLVAFYFMIVASFLAIALAQRNKQHIRVHFFSNPIPQKGKVALDVIVYLVSALVCAGLALYGTEIALAKLGTERTHGFPSLVIWPARWAVPAAWTLAGIQFLADAVHQAWHFRDGRLLDEELETAEQGQQGD